MTDIQFVERLRRELSDPQRWPEIQGVVSSRADPSLAANELLVSPVIGPAVDPVVFRVTVEGLAPRTDAGLSP